MLKFGFAALLSIFTALISGDVAGAQVDGTPAPDTRIVLQSGAPDTVYVLPATPQTTQTGFFDNSRTPVLRIKPGDTVAVETRTLFDNRLVPGVTLDELVKMRAAVVANGGSAHTITGPIYVDGTTPGDVLKIRINKIVPRAYGANFSMPGTAGEFPQQFPRGALRFVYLDTERTHIEFLPGIMIPLKPFPGTIGVARAEPGAYATTAPGRFGGNMDLRELTAGTTLYLPVFVKGALFWTGDSHAAQGNGEVNQTAVETAFNELNLTFDVIRGHSLNWPRIETPTDWITVGYDRDLNKALDILKSETSKLLIEQHRASTGDADRVVMRMWDCAVAEVVDVVKGAFCRIPKSLSPTTAAKLPTAETAREYVSIGRSEDLNRAMDIASLAMINLLSDKRKLDRLDVYGLASVAMDCRIAAPTGRDKQVICMIPKSLWSESRQRPLDDSASVPR